MPGQPEKTQPAGDKPDTDTKPVDVPAQEEAGKVREDSGGYD